MSVSFVRGLLYSHIRNSKFQVFRAHRMIRLRSAVCSAFVGGTVIPRSLPGGGDSSTFWSAEYLWVFNRATPTSESYGNRAVCSQFLTPKNARYLPGIVMLISSTSEWKWCHRTAVITGRFARTIKWSRATEHHRGEICDWWWYGRTQ